MVSWASDAFVSLLARTEWFVVSLQYPQVLLLAGKYDEV